MGPRRHCSRTACGRPAVATLTYVYADSTAVLGPLAVYAEPHCYDLCADHAERMTAPRGWDIVRLQTPAAAPIDSDDLSAFLDVVRQPRVTEPEPETDPEQREAASPIEAPSATGMRRGHLRILRENQ